MDSSEVGDEATGAHFRVQDLRFWAWGLRSVFCIYVKGFLGPRRHEGSL